MRLGGFQSRKRPFEKATYEGTSVAQPRMWNFIRLRCRMHCNASSVDLVEWSWFKAYLHSHDEP